MADERNACPLRGAGREATVPCLGPRCMWWVRRSSAAQAEFGSCAVALANAPAPVANMRVATRDLEGARREA